MFLQDLSLMWGYWLIKCHNLTLKNRVLPCRWLTWGWCCGLCLWVCTSCAWRTHAPPPWSPSDAAAPTTSPEFHHDRTGVWSQTHCGPQAQSATHPKLRSNTVAHQLNVLYSEYIHMTGGTHTTYQFNTLQHTNITSQTVAHQFNLQHTNTTGQTMWPTAHQLNLQHTNTTGQTQWPVAHQLNLQHTNTTGQTQWPVAHQLNLQHTNTTGQTQWPVAHQLNL